MQLATVLSAIYTRSYLEYTFSQLHACSSSIRVILNVFGFLGPDAPVSATFQRHHNLHLAHSQSKYIHCRLRSASGRRILMHCDHPRCLKQCKMYTDEAPRSGASLADLRCPTRDHNNKKTPCIQRLIAQPVIRRTTCFGSRPPVALDSAALASRDPESAVADDANKPSCGAWPGLSATVAH